MENYQLLNYNDTVNESHLATNSVYRLWWPYRLMFTSKGKKITIKRQKNIQSPL